MSYNMISIHHSISYCNECHDDLSLGVKLRRHIRSGPPKPAPATFFIFVFSLFSMCNVFLTPKRAPKASPCHLLYLGLKKSDVIIIERLTKKGLSWIKALSETKTN